MPLQKLLEDLKAQLAHLDAAGTAKGAEQVVVAVKPPQGARGPRFVLAGSGEREFNGMKLAPHHARQLYGHLDLRALEQRLEESVGKAEAALVITDGVFSMRGDHAPVDRIAELCRKYDARYPRGCLLVVDDSHGVGGFGTTGRGTEEVTGGRADVLIGTLGKAMGVNGGYVVCEAAVIRWLREKNPFYIYSNPIAPGEAAAALAALELIRGREGVGLLSHLRAATQRFRDGLVRLGFETIPGQHAVVPLLVRDTERTAALVAFLREHD